MIEIYRVAPMILNMPTEAGKNHSNVTPGYFHTIDVTFNEA